MIEEIGTTPKGLNIEVHESINVDPTSALRGYMTTYSGLKFYPIDPQPESITIEDIAHSLSLTCRWSGHITRFFSVAQHSIYVSEMVSSKNKLAALLHDSSEAYLGDMIRPIKYLPEMAIYKDIEKKATAAIAKKFGLETLEKNEEIHWADNLILALEAVNFRRPVPQFALDILEENKGAKELFFDSWEPEYAEKRFLRAFKEYQEPRKHF